MKQNRFIPNQLPLRIREAPHKRGEVLVYDALLEQLNHKQRDWVMVYSANWMAKRHRNEPPRIGETDFLLAHPEHGLVIVEVKGGQIEFEGEQWYSRDKGGRRHEIDPFQQVGRNAYELCWKFEQMKRWDGGSEKDKYARWVIFPESVTPRNAVFPPYYDQAMVTDLDGMPNIVDELLKACRFWYGGSWQHPAAPHACDLLIDLFGKPRTFTLPLAETAKEDSARIEKLTDSQFAVIAAISRCPRAAIAGGAGSGKTWLARKRAVQLADEGFKVLLMCKSIPLAVHLEQTTDRHDQLTICSYKDLLRRLDPDSEQISDDEYAWTLASFISDHPELAFDAVFVDEGQDFNKEEWPFVESLLGTEKAGIFYVFYDDNQQLSNRDTELPANLVPVQLEDNVRTTRAIHKDMSRFYKGNQEQRPQGPPGRHVEQANSEGNLPKKVREVISDLLKAERFQESDIVVLTPLETTLSTLSDLSLADGRSLRVAPEPNGKDVLLASVKDFKGLEKPVVVVGELDQLPTDEAERRRILYAALSRAKSHLILIDLPKNEFA
ncbi:nuclease-related domain-containing DEAD/DEAH box helicase [Rubripirellula tenax]|nr:ATP-binding domain-containing protein [Rubripirellula tenax]